MKKWSNKSYSEKIQMRICLLWLLFAAMAAYMVIVSCLGGGDSRVVTNSADMFADIVLFGGMGAVIWRICQNKKLLKNRMMLKAQMLKERDERNQYLHDKSGGIAMDATLIFALFVTETAAMFNMTAFYIALTILFGAALFKAGAWLFYAKCGPMFRNI